MDKVLLIGIIGGVGYLIFKQETKEEITFYRDIGSSAIGSTIGNVAVTAFFFGGSYLIDKRLKK